MPTAENQSVLLRTTPQTPPGSAWWRWRWGAAPSNRDPLTEAPSADQTLPVSVPAVPTKWSLAPVQCFVGGEARDVKTEQKDWAVIFRFCLDWKPDEMEKNLFLSKATVTQTKTKSSIPFYRFVLMAGLMSQHCSHGLMVIVCLRNQDSTATQPTWSDISETVKWLIHLFHCIRLSRGS